jgi:thiamine biosynthesis lipoprotein
MNEDRMSPVLTSTDPVSTVEIVDHRWRTDLVLTVRGDAVQTAEPGVRATFLGQVERLEAVASRFRADSEITRVNESAGMWTEVSGLFVELLEVALSAAEQTGGLVDPCLGRHVDAAGYRSWDAGAVSVPVVPELVAAAPNAWQRIDVRGLRVRIPEGVHLDLGATAKAWLADELAERIAEGTGLDVVANMGGDLRAVSHGASWVVGMDHALPGVPGMSIEVTDAGLATSGQGGRRWRTTSGWAHHIIDPHTGLSAASRWWAVSVLAASATGANAASTAALVLDGAAPQWLMGRGLDGVLTEWLGSGPATEHLVGRWPGQERAA